ncbi:uncharacterized protein L3040_000074 [Drepanopeziza brunnea f. sp. 'multigermtubi']|uniref:GNAT family acetyltransferase n=1 Tax=Marssonina brunnea f. sp. multigermtubi (strain MB_m1) TaxID=1072389 RepID=K1WNM6_MARBU|nr:GNAT family acetyltransferase [Drepanopeziza brunnea f. sp. 'multigermtubi' MB_m1]EKD14551.1 GNAT family acetyltransferase [Drepanopeziza brunnea f. sp. 'multigermtubi' MB_m1]KAJ5053783.1 hypothetical protein L3040_000074 [Drepanopeziza brunnea f. sp. 'multigermtubi']
MAFTIRTAVHSDMPSVVSIDMVANRETSALITMNLLPPAELEALFTSRYTHYLSRPSRYRFLLATTSMEEPGGRGREEIVGFLVGAYPKKGGEEVVDFKPAIPEDERARELFIWFFGLSAEDKKMWFRDDMWELESLQTSPAYQRRGIGSLLLTRWVEEVDAANGTTFVRASPRGRGLYAKFGWVDQSIWSVDVTKYGRAEPIVNYNMKREAKEQVST